ncbi:MAG: ChaN family lipoprotein [Betaproteobacteria bacterium]|nr:ChaN family lipoprotein [Betaproteobacteria bacterium]MDE2622349.1 ChaN family lipoprotein [Betaproteobacteria bacterium]
MTMHTRFILLLCFVTWNAFADAVEGVPALPPPAQDADYLLLGEVHDNPAGHALRLQWLKALLMQRPRALAMEQFDLDNQNGLEAALAQAEKSGMKADPAALHAVAEAGGFNFKGWRWPLYEPVLALAVEQGIPLYPANLSRKNLGEILGGQHPVPPEPRQWSKEQRDALLHEVRVGHCNLMPEDELPLLAGAQRARDKAMAEALIRLHQKSGRPVILLAGNGHMRKDLAVPVWLHQLDPQAKTVSVAVLERGGSAEDHPPQAAFDAVYWVERENRPDPCEALRQRLKKFPVR